MPSVSHEDLRGLLCALGIEIRNAVLRGRTGQDADALSAVAGVGGGDTIYAIDKFGEDAILQWFAANWPVSAPVQVVMEGIEEVVCFPADTAVADTLWKCIIDPIDGTRGIMYDKRSAWALAGIAPQRGDDTRLSHIVVAAMTEIPTSKQWRADQLSTTTDGPLVCTAHDLRAGTISPLDLTPSTAKDFSHGFASFAKYFPEGRTLTAQIEEQIWDELVGQCTTTSPLIFDDQYISTGGQFYEVIAGHDRLVGDLRPIVFRVLDFDGSALVCHPYDACAWLVLAKAGAVYEHPLGGFPDAPLDTESGLAWIVYANESLAALARPVVQRVLRQFLP